MATKLDKEQEFRLDDATVGLFSRQLEDIEAEIDREETADLPFASGLLVPLDEQNKPWAQTTTYRRVSRVGSWKLVRNYPTDIPMINVLTEEFTQRVFKWAAGYWYSDDDIEAAIRGEISIEQEDIAGVVETSKQKLNELIAFGDRSLGMHGFINHPDALRSFAPFALNASSTPDECLAVLNDAVNSVVALTQQIEKPDTLLLDLITYQYLMTARMEGVQDSQTNTILKFFLETNPYIKNVQPVNELMGAGLDGLSVMIAYKRDRSKIKAKVMQPLTWKDMQRKGLGYERPAVMKYAGLSLRRPYSIHIVALPA